MSIETFLKEKREMCEKATSGYWEEVHPNADEGDIRVQVWHVHKRTIIDDSDAVAWKVKAEDAAFIADARTTMPKLIDALQVAVKALSHYQRLGRNDLDEHSKVAIKDIERLLEGKKDE